MKRTSFKRGKPWPDRHEVQRKARVKPSLVPKALGKRLAPKDEAPIRDNKHLGRVAGERCLICGLPHPHAHHLREAFPRTMGVRVGDNWTVPLCATHHAELHTVNNMSFWTKYAVAPVRWAAEFYAETLKLRGI